MFTGRRFFFSLHPPLFTPPSRNLFPINTANGDTYVAVASLRAPNALGPGSTDSIFLGQTEISYDNVNPNFDEPIEINQLQTSIEGAKLQVKVYQVHPDDASFSAELLIGSSTLEVSTILTSQMNNTPALTIPLQNPRNPALAKLLADRGSCVVIYPPWNSHSSSSSSDEGFDNDNGLISSYGFHQQQQQYQQGGGRYDAPATLNLSDLASPEKLRQHAPSRGQQQQHQLQLQYQQQPQQGGGSGGNLEQTYNEDGSPSRVRPVYPHPPPHITPSKANTLAFPELDTSPIRAPVNMSNSNAHSSSSSASSSSSMSYLSSSRPHYPHPPPHTSSTYAPSSSNASRTSAVPPPVAFTVPLNDNDEPSGHHSSRLEERGEGAEHGGTYPTSSLLPSSSSSSGGGDNDNVMLPIPTLPTHLQRLRTKTRQTPAKNQSNKSVSFLDESTSASSSSLSQQQTSSSSASTSGSTSTSASLSRGVTQLADSAITELVTVLSTLSENSWRNRITAMDRLCELCKVRNIVVYIYIYIYVL